MFVPLWLIGLAAALLLLLAVLAFRRPSGDMIEEQRRTSPPPSPTIDEQALLAGPEICAALAAGHKLEAIKLVRENSGLGLKEAKELVERHIQ